jgi:glycosyltransferase involved in cell wall biosynthesis
MPFQSNQAQMAYKVSIVTPSFNQGRFIERTILSVLEQGVKDLEYFVVDGGSRDETVEILKRYESRLWWVSEPDRGQADAVNKGLRRCRGDLIGWLNSDDIYYPGMVAAACEFLASRPEVDVVYGDANHIDAQDKVIEPYPTEEWDPRRLVDACYLCQPAVFFRRSVIEKFGLLNERLNFCMDYEYWLRLAAGEASFGRLRQVIAGSRLHPETKTLGSRVEFHREINDMLHERLGRVPDRWLVNYAHALLDEKGVPRTARFRFPVLVSAASIMAAMLWNRRISPGMLQLAGTWVGAGVQGARPGRVKR